MIGGLWTCYDQRAIDVDILIVYSNRFVRCKFSNSSPNSQVAIGEIGFGQGMEYGHYISVTATVYHTCALGVRVMSNKCVLAHL